MIHSLWFRLSFCFAAITLLGICLLNLFPTLVWGYTAFQRFVVPQAIYEVVASEQLVLAEALRNPDSGGWADLAKRNLSKKLLKMQDDTDDFRITNCADPELYFQAFDASGKQVFSGVSVFPAHVAQLLSMHGTGQDLAVSRAERLEQKGHIWVTMPVADVDGRIQRHIDLLFIAVFDAGKVLRLMLNSYLECWYLFILIFSFVGLLCGLVASHFVTGRLKRMDTVASAWRKGNFSPRIAGQGKPWA